MEQWYATGKRKTAVARVFLRPGSGEITVNGKKIQEHFQTEAQIKKILAPFKITGTEKRFCALITVEGGGISAQADAVRHGISRALTVFDKDFRPLLKKEGFLTRDARVKERKKYGLRGARKRPQYSKR